MFPLRWSLAGVANKKANLWRIEQRWSLRWEQLVSSPAHFAVSSSLPDTASIYASETRQGSARFSAQLKEHHGPLTTALSRRRS